LKKIYLKKSKTSLGWFLAVNHIVDIIGLIFIPGNIADNNKDV